MRTVFTGWLVSLCLLLTGCSYEILHYSDNPQKAFASNNATLTSIPASGIHIVESGETLFSIGFRYGLDYKELAAFNRINPPYTIFPKQKIRLGTQPDTDTATAQADSVKTPISPPDTKVTATRKTETKSEVAVSKPSVVIPSSSPVIVNTSSSNKAEPLAPMQTNDAPISAWDWPVDGEVVTRFSNAGVSSKGINIKASEGSLIKAVANGTVVYAGSGLIGYGNLVIVKHNEVYLSAYAYNERILVKEQQNVQMGDSLAVIGGKGNERPLLHFEVRRDGRPIDPLSVLPKR